MRYMPEDIQPKSLPEKAPSLQRTRKTTEKAAEFPGERESNEKEENQTTEKTFCKEKRQIR